MDIAVLLYLVTGQRPMQHDPPAYLFLLDYLSGWGSWQLFELSGSLRSPNCVG